MRRKVLGMCLVLPGLLWLASPSARSDAQDKTDPKVGGKVQKVDDQTFAKKAALGGMAEVALGKLAEDKAANADVKMFGKRMVMDHSKANKMLKEICSKENLTVPKAIDKEHKQQMDKLAKLEGAEFDRAYMEHMVKDHEEDVAEFAAAAKNLKNEALRQFAAETLPIIQEHLKMAKQICDKVKSSGK